MIIFLCLLETFLIGWWLGDTFHTKEEEMDINRFAVMVSKKEGLKKELSIAQIKEVLNVSNALLGGCLYWIIRHISEKEIKNK